MPDPPAGDEAVAFRSPEAVIVRTGATVTEYDDGGFPGEQASVPMGVVTARSVKLARMT